MSRVEVLVRGTASGEVLRLEEPLSFWGGVDPKTGRIIETRHPQHGELLEGRILSMPHGRGSSSASSILAETLRLGCGPIGIILESRDAILVAGALVAAELYGVNCPVVISQRKPRTGETWALTGQGLDRVR